MLAILVVGAVRACDYVDTILQLRDGQIMEIIEPKALECIGFGPPVHGDIMTLKKNRAIPLKAELFEDGIPVTSTDINSPPVLQITFDSGESAVPSTAIDGVSPGQAFEGNQFEWIEGLWKFVLSVKKCCSSP